MICSHEHALNRLKLSNEGVRRLIITKQIDGTITNDRFIIDDCSINQYLKG